MSDSQLSGEEESQNRDPESEEPASPDAVQQEIDKWVEFHDQIKDYLQYGITPSKTARNIPKASESYSLGSDGNLYRANSTKDHKSSMKLLVIRNYEDRLRIVKDIHVNTGKEGRHNRRDRMLELLRQQYYWKGQRRDVCECIASCELCSAGFGAKRRSKPPRQGRDVRSPAKLQKLSVSPLTVSSSIATGNPFHASNGDTVKILQGSTSNSLFTVPLSTQPSDSLTEPQYVTSNPRISLGDQSGSIESSSRFGVPNTETNTTDMLLDSDTSTFASSAFQQIFTTIDEPTSNSESSSLVTSGHPVTCRSSRSSTEISESAAVSSFTQTGAPTMSSGASPSLTAAELDANTSIYQLLFRLPAEPNEAMFPSVIEAMHAAMQQSVDPVRLADACGTYLHQNLGLAPGCSVLVAPSRAAGYLLAIAASMLQVDPLSVNQQVSSQKSTPLAIIHDSCCEATSLKMCTSLVGGINWNLGTITTPMNKQMLSMAISSNRVAAVFHQPYCYPKHCQYVSLPVLSSVCHSRNVNISIVIDANRMPVQTLSLVQIITTVKEFLALGADAVLLPEMEEFHGPPQTCLLIGSTELLQDVAQNIPLLQSQICLPLTCTSYDLVGTVVAYKTFQVASLKRGILS